MSNERVNVQRNVTKTPMNTSCHLCHYSGYSNVCTFFRGGECPYATMRKTVIKDMRETSEGAAI